MTDHDPRRPEDVGRRSHLISGYLDDELDPTERAEFEAELVRSPELAQELEAFRQLRGVTAAMKLDPFPDDVFDDYWRTTYNRLERRFGWLLVSIGAIILLAAALARALPDFVHWLLASPEDPWWVRLAIGLLSVGGAVIVVSVIRERFFTERRDPYREVKR